MTWHAGLIWSFKAAAAISCGCLSSHQRFNLGRTDWSRLAWLQGIKDLEQLCMLYQQQDTLKTSDAVGQSIASKQHQHHRSSVTSGKLDRA